MAEAKKHLLIWNKIEIRPHSEETETVALYTLFKETREDNNVNKYIIQSEDSNEQRHKQDFLNTYPITKGIITDHFKHKSVSIEWMINAMSSTI